MGQSALMALGSMNREQETTCHRPPTCDAPARLAELAARLHTINPETGLSTDFLNQYNELSMLLDLAADDADMLEEIVDWAPRSYHDHFAASGFKDWPLVVEAYALCPPHIRSEFDEAVSILNSVAISGIAELQAACANGSDQSDAIRALAAELQAAIVHTGGLINGSHTLGSQAQVDTLFARAQNEQKVSPLAELPGSSPDSGIAATPAPAATDDELLDQDAIDALFD